MRGYAKGWRMALPKILYGVPLLALGALALGQHNDYYLIRVLVPLDNAGAATAAARLADTLFPRVAAAYGDNGAGRSVSRLEAFG